ncbi:AbrB/MazE/SpoVT family DNA-binding domain-containing protein [Anabaena sp. UHCC 0399]|uniref:AbrB/MazE/SpoVT family DNA-binding domain-containing protein n=1 Tax=Anabaena sp. UHCC 0399 TaxID=3110238 RepID=UPI002B2124D9|nr:AbrB/MazE/SpoVT family DNA-binding domain-containing protein [Anabaena sp. UHCC 0399]MEA5565050.1 AbrB/MazE/SpoVT family DNA-binding domain-containing protein [Anabaena sp. UHCC 0399]
MQTHPIIRVTDEKQITLPPEIQSQLQPGDEYRIIIQGNSIVLEKITQSNVNLDDFLKELETLESDPNQPTMEEISQIVKEVRQ